MNDCWNINLFTNIHLQYEILYIHSIQNMHLSAKCICSCNDVLKIYNRTINTHRYLLDMRISLQFTLNWILKIQFDGRYLCVLWEQEWNFQIKKNHCVYVYLFVRVHVHIFNALMGLSPYIYININIHYKQQKSTHTYGYFLLPNVITDPV